MSGTKSPSPKAQATSGSAVIVSHGQPSAPAPAEAALRAFAAKVAKGLPGWHVGSATLAAPGALEAALAAAGEPRPLIYPMFMTEGWFTRTALPKRLAGHPAQIIAPFGADPGLPQFAAGLLRDALQSRGWQARDTRLMLAAHGSGRSHKAADDTSRFAAALSRLLPLSGLHIGFVEEPPFLAEAAADLGAQAICLPFFAARGEHVTEDLPAALQDARFQGLLLDPIGCAPGAAALVARAIHAAGVIA